MIDNNNYLSYMQEYMNARKAMEADTALCKMLSDYDNCVSELTCLLENPNYDAQKAVTLSNDIEYLQEQISRNAVYNRVKEAFAKLQAYACAGDCSGCAKDCPSRKQ